MFPSNQPTNQPTDRPTDRRTNQPTNQPTPWSRVLLEKPINTQLLKKFPDFYVTWRFFTVFTRTRHWSSSWAI